METTRIKTTGVQGRITPRQVVEAYEKTGIEPERNQFYNPDVLIYGCAVAAVVANENYENIDDFIDFAEGTNEHEDSWFQALRLNNAGVEESYMVWFTVGFDGSKMNYEPFNEVGRKGLKDGIKAAKAVFG